MLEDVLASDKLRDLEAKQHRTDILIEHLTDAIDEIKDSIKEALDLKGKVDNHGGQLNQLWPRVDSLRQDITNLDKKVDVLVQAHNACQDRQKEERQWRSQRAGSLADKLIWLSVAVIGFGAAVMAIKGFLK